MYFLLMTTHHNTPFQIKHTASTDKNKTMCNCHAGTSFSAHSERSSDTSLVSTVNDNCIAKYTEFYLFIVFKSGFYFNKTHLLKLFFVWVSFFIRSRQIHGQFNERVDGIQVKKNWINNLNTLFSMKSQHRFFFSVLNLNNF